MYCDIKTWFEPTSFNKNLIFLHTTLIMKQDPLCYSCSLYNLNILTSTQGANNQNMPSLSDSATQSAVILQRKYRISIRTVNLRNDYDRFDANNT